MMHQFKRMYKDFFAGACLRKDGRRRLFLHSGTSFNSIIEDVDNDWFGFIEFERFYGFLQKYGVFK